jgi:hypothetical protein
VKHVFWRRTHRSRTKIFQQQSRERRKPLFERGCDARSYRGAGFVRDQRYALAGLHGEARFHGVARAGHQFRLWGTEFHIHPF